MKILIPTTILILVACNSNVSTSTPTRTIVTSDGSRTVAPTIETQVINAHDAGCPDGTVHVSGEYCPSVEQECLRWLPAGPSGLQLRCAEFKQPSKCLSQKRVHKDFCIDRYEFPNVKGESPPIDVTWIQAGNSCKDLGKRLCTADEWTFACEGDEMKPYPYGDGYHRDDLACNIDKESMDPSLPRSEWPKHYKAEASGSRPLCVSPFGVFDMTGNVDELVNNVGGRSDEVPYVSGLKGGYWGAVRNRCRPMTTVHGPSFSFYQIGFRCCSDVKK